MPIPMQMQDGVYFLDVQNVDAGCKAWRVRMHIVRIGLLCCTAIKFHVHACVYVHVYALISRKLLATSNPCYAKSLWLQGLMSYDLTSRQLRVLANAVSNSSALDPGLPITYVNDLDIAEDGGIYFTASQAGIRADTLHTTHTSNPCK